MGTDNDGLYVLDKDYDQSKHLSPHIRSCNAPNTVMCMLKDSGGNMWVGSYLEGLAYLEKGKQSSIMSLLSQGDFAMQIEFLAWQRTVLRDYG